MKESRHGRHESEIMKYIAANTTLPVPKVYDFKFDEQRQSFFIVMDYVPGDTLERRWKNFTSDQRDFVCHQLAECLAQLRKLTGDYIGTVNRGAIRFGLWQSRWGGPFDNEKEFNDWMLEAGGDAAECGLTHDHAIHFAHADLSPRNIMVDENGRITGILDWERAGWFPEYWDIVRIYYDRPVSSLVPDFVKHLESAFGKDTYKKEYRSLLKVFRYEVPFSGGRIVQPKPPSN